jgi:hypothetical protein
VASWEVITSTLPADGWVSQIAFSPAGDRLAVSYNGVEGSTLMLIDAASGKTLGAQRLDFQPEGVAFFQGGEALVAYGTLQGVEPGLSEPEGLRLEAVSAPSMARLWQRDLPEVTSGQWCLEGCDAEHGMQLYAYWAPGIVVSPQENRLYIFHADEDKMTRLSLADGSSEDVKLQEAQSWLERLLTWTAGVAYAKGGMQGITRQAVLSPDGKTLYALSTSTDSELNPDGWWEVTETNTELVMIDTQNGAVLARQPASGYTLRLTPDGKHLLSEQWMDPGMETQVWSADDLSPLALLDGWEVTLTADAEGNDLYLAKRGENTIREMGIVDPQSWQVQTPWEIKGRALWVPVR